MKEYEECVSKEGDGGVISATLSPSSSIPHAPESTRCTLSNALTITHAALVSNALTTVKQVTQQLSIPLLTITAPTNVQRITFVWTGTNAGVSTSFIH